ncbi:MAG: xanthine dehydrogenase small subunit [Acidobacteriota bacterium]|nr:xanthine dehydrogenase small subunit [Acidobacteriota bacterium]MDH3525315.1 xanthine dehydrogenase small subunit [Acidobacteriota bacterium]
MPSPDHPVPDRADGVVRFLLDGEVHSVRDVDPNTTVLEYLREHLRKTGTKEGCAEGDCGACTVVVGELEGEGVRLRAINSCIQFLPTLDGKELFTVESLRGRDGSLHPVQRALVDCHGSQCGFCTPGFVMSLFALYKTEAAPSRRRIHDVLAGNLCRCTGYRPIVDAACKMYEYGAADGGDWLRRPCAGGAPGGEADPEETARTDRLRGIRRRGALTYSGPAPGGGRRTFFAPRDLSELAALRQSHPDAFLLAGGTDVGLWVTKGHRELDAVIYLGNVAELRRLAVTPSHIEVGAGVTVTDAQDVIGRHYPDMGEMYRRFASPPIRNAATLGGNVANGSPIGDSMPGLIALGSTLVLRRGEETRELPLDEFYLAYQKTALEPGELVERVRIPLADPASRFGMYKVSKRFDQDISAVCGAYRIRLGEDGRARDVRICYGGMAAIPKRASGCERELEGRPWSEATLAGALAALDRDYTPIRDMRASADYRRLVARNLLRKFFFETSGFAGETRVIDHGGAADG